MTDTTLEDAATELASRLNIVVDAAIDTDVRFVAQLKDDDRRAAVEASRSYGRLPAFPLVRLNEDRGSPALLLDVNYVLEVACSREYVGVVTSSIGLWVDVTGGRKKHRPLVRLEYDRDPRTVDRPAGHVHLHANSPEMAWVYGSSGRAAPDLHALHFPVGAQRFRPTLEDFLLFLNRERLYTDFKPNWRPTVLRSLQEWSVRQAAASVQKYPQVAAGELTKLGYTVAPPADGASYTRNA